MAIKLKNIINRYHYRAWAKKAIDNRCQPARSIRQPVLTSFAKMLEDLAPP